MNKTGFIGASLLLALAALASSLFVVDQRQFGVVYQFGQIQRVINEPGLYGKIPLIQTVAYIDKRLLTLDSQDLQPLLTKESSSTGTRAGASPTRKPTCATSAAPAKARARSSSTAWCATPSRKKSTAATCASCFLPGATK